VYDHLAERVGRTPERPLRLPALRRDGVEIETECSISAIGDGMLMISLQRREESFGVDSIEEGRGPAVDAAHPTPETMEHLQRYRLLFEHAPLGVWHFDERGVITACNDQFVRVMGSSKRALVGLSQLTLHDSFVVECVRGVLAGQRTHYEGDYRSATAGKVTPVRADFAPIRNDDGAVIGGVGILEDITERKHAEEALRESNATLRAVFEASPLPIMSFDSDTRVYMWNPAAERLFGYSEQEVLGQPFPCVPPERAAEFRAGFDRVVAGGLLAAFETYYRRRDGSRLEVSVSAAPLFTGQNAGVIAVVSDISESKRALVERARLLELEQAARRAAEEAQHRLQILAHASAEIASSLDERETVQRAARMAMPEFAQLGVIYLREDDGTVHQVAGARSQTGEPAEVGVALAEPSPLVLEVIRSRRSHFAAQPPLGWPALEALKARALICVPLLVRGRVLGAMALARDPSAGPFAIHDLPFAEEIGRRAGVAIDNAQLFRRTEQALRWRDEFLSIASHELRTPVTSLGLSAQNLEAMVTEGTLATAPPTIVGRGVSTVVRQTRHLSHLIDELLDLSRIQAGRFEVAPNEESDLVEVVRAATGRLARQLAVADCALTVEAPVPVVGHWDRSRLEQVVTNLVTNAMKFGARKPIEVKVTDGPDRAALVVTDHGIGIAPEHQTRIFDRFQRGAVSSRHYAGLGLGLYIVRQIVEAHRGTISVASVHGQGATFTVTLPKRQTVI
jgi:PAS domain S-box-containing protein